MYTRKAQIIAWAVEQSQQFIDRIPAESTTAKRNYENILAVCKYLVERRKMLRPTAPEVHETALAKPFSFEWFPSARTIYNDYGEMLAFWRKAYTDINHAETDPPLAYEALIGWDASHLDSNSKYVIGALQRICLELKRKLDASKQLITDHVVINMDSFSENEESTMKQLATWLKTIESCGFALNGFGVVVTRNTPPGTIVMDLGLIEALQRMVATYDTTVQLKNAQTRNGSYEQPGGV
ncbi:hypothetical protein HFO39_14145 [Rhizobium leguminosarum]|uniref:hypothetical protein n=1 Tax=Rhizobium leguminosarum TaxID=384 RepID=UPI001C93E9A6|nr:hypothetical protein [Rhizobium leguminosarum]MBY5635910.1 hypothetical protein [Rhizobium leguminosarum]